MTPLRLALFLLVLTPSAAAQLRNPAAGNFELDHHTRIADPKLPGGGAHYALHLSAGSGTAQATMEVLQGGSLLVQPWSGVLTETAITLTGWDGRDAQGDWCPTGSYMVRFSAPGISTLDLPLDLVRLGVTEMEANDSPAGDDEFPMVYFRKAGAYGYYATPQIHEYANLAPAGEISDLDQDDGQPRPVVAVHLDTAEPVLDGAGGYETATYNYPLAYVKETSPRLELRWGAGGTTSQGQAMSVGYPVAGHDLRAVVRAGGTRFASGPITPGGLTTFDLDPLPGDVRRTDLNLEVRWQYSASGSGVWLDVPGRRVIPLRVYTLLGPPLWKAGVNGIRYAGPWVEVAEYVATWKELLAMPTYGPRVLTALFVQGFFGQNGAVVAPIEGVLYDCGPLGGDGGATHYFDEGGDRMELSRLLHAHDKGVYVNCTDNMGATTTMLSMLGASNVRPLRLGSMNLKAIWGIGAPEYTTNLWGAGSHSFSYHHIVTDDDGVTVTDTCMQLDEDGSPGSTPGYPGWNHHRKWKGPEGYNKLSSYNGVGQTLETLPGLK